jgi:hypothetical protein
MSTAGGPMPRSHLIGAALLMQLVVTVSTAEAQVLTAEQCMASGFTPVPSSQPVLAREMEQAGMYGFQAARAQPDYPRWAAIDGVITLGCGWSFHPAAESAIRMLLQAPQDPGTDNVTHRTEPVGKEEFRGGVLLYTKSTYIDVGIEPVQPDLVTYAGQWYGAHAGGILAIGVANVLGSRAAIRSWIGEVIDRTTPRP